MSDIFENVASKFKNSPSALFLFIVSLVMLVIGVNHFVEDVYSSYRGLLSIEEHFGLNVQVYSWTYWTMSLAPQIASVVYAYIYLADTRKSWALWVSVVCQVVDFSSDLWFRSNGAAFSDWGVTLVSAAITLAFFTLGSEVFISVGFGLCLKLFVPALSFWKSFKSEKKRVDSQFRDGKFVGGQENRNSPQKEEKPYHFSGFQETKPKIRKIPQEMGEFQNLHRVITGKLTGRDD